MSRPGQRVTCAIHGDTVATLACVHLATGVACGFHAQGDPADPWPDAWCDLCAEVLAVNGGVWMPSAQDVADFQVACVGCWEAARDRNRFVPPLARGVDRTLNDDELDRLLHHAAAHVDVRNAAVQQQWGWHDPDVYRFDATGRIVFDGGFHEALVADVQFLGARTEATGTFRWAWSAMTVLHPQARAATMVRAYGVVRGVERLSQEAWTGGDDEAWHVAALAAYLCGAQALYVARADDADWYVLLDGFRRGV